MRETNKVTRSNPRARRALHRLMVSPFFLDIFQDWEDFQDSIAALTSKA